MGGRIARTGKTPRDGIPVLDRAGCMDSADTNKPEVWWQTGRASEAKDESLKHWKPGHGTDTNNPKKVPKDLRHLPTDMTNDE